MRNILPANLTLLGLSRFYYFLSIIFLACASKASAPLQNPQRFAEVYSKILLASGTSVDSNLQQLEDKKIKLARADSVLKSLGFDRQQFEAAVKYFSARPERWQKVYTHVVKILEEHNNTNDSTRTKARSSEINAKEK